MNPGGHLAGADRVGRAAISTAGGEERRKAENAERCLGGTHRGGWRAWGKQNEGRKREGGGFWESVAELRGR
jgi:hypothetical protein